MTIAQFKRITLALPEATESAHMGHSGFRVKGKVFASLGYPDAGHGMVKLAPGQQALFVDAEPAMFFPAKGAWGKQGATCIVLRAAKAKPLRAAKAKPLRAALTAAWRNTAPKPLVRAFDEETP